eukprot:5186220-Pleurochrysis_carterae.AAC.3
MAPMRPEWGLLGHIRTTQRRSLALADAGAGGAAAAFASPRAATVPTLWPAVASAWALASSCAALPKKELHVRCARGVARLTPHDVRAAMLPSCEYAMSSAAVAARSRSSSSSAGAPSRCIGHGARHSRSEEGWCWRWCRVDCVDVRICRMLRNADVEDTRSSI